MFSSPVRAPLTPPSENDSKGILPYQHDAPQTIMATELAMPAAATTQYKPYTSPRQYSLYNAQPQTISPVDSVSGTPQDASPTSPRTGLANAAPHTRQLRPPKSPLYIPAVLRPNEFPSRRPNKSSPPTPPQSMSSSLDNLINAKPMSRRLTTDSGKQGLGLIEERRPRSGAVDRVTSMPTRKHWKPDSEASICDETTCTRSFTYFTRRHHCRRCGNIFCDSHSPYAIPLDQDANFHPAGARSRACEYCFTEYNGWEITRGSRSNSTSSTDTVQADVASTPTVNCMGRKGALGGVFGKGGIAESLGASVPRDWNWSTF